MKARLSIASCLCRKIQRKGKLCHSSWRLWQESNTVSSQSQRSSRRLSSAIYRSVLLPNETVRSSLRLFSSSSSSRENLDPVYQLLEANKVNDAALWLAKRCDQRGGFNGNGQEEDEVTEILDSLSKSPQQAEELLKALQEIEDCVDLCRPRSHHYLSVLKAWSDFRPPSAKRAEALLQYMQQAGIDVDIQCYRQVLRAWTRVKKAEAAQALLGRMIQRKIQLDAITFSLVLRAWSYSKSPLAFQKAEDLLSEMKKLGVEPSADCYLQTIQCWAKSKKKGSEKRIEELYTSIWTKFQNKECRDPKLIQAAMLGVLQACSRVSNAHRAEEHLLNFAEEYRKNKLVPPTLEMCLSVLSTWPKSKSSRRASRAEKLLSLMEKDDALPRPDVACYTTVLHCWAGSNKPNAAQRAELLLRLMECNDDTPPNVMTYTCVLNAWSRSKEADAPIQAERLLDEMQKQNIIPDRLVFSTMITVWGRSEYEESVDRAESYFQILRDTDVANPEGGYRPTVVEYTAIMQAWASYVQKYPEKSLEAVSRVEDLLEEMLHSEGEHTRPNSLTYAAMLKTFAAARKIPDRLDRAVALLETMERENVEITPYILNLAKKCNVTSDKKNRGKN